MINNAGMYFIAAAGFMGYSLIATPSSCPENPVYMGLAIVCILLSAWAEDARW